MCMLLAFYFRSVHFLPQSDSGPHGIIEDSILYDIRPVWSSTSLWISNQHDTSNTTWYFTIMSNFGIFYREYYNKVIVQWA